MKKFVLVFALNLISALGLHAADLGSAAKPLDLKEWVKGSPVHLADGKGTNIYVVEFWATWCPPCRTSIPHLTEVQKKFKDKGVVIIGVTDEESDVVKKFVKQMGGKMEYRIAIDTGKTWKDYAEAFGLEGIPQAFIVDKEGKVVWNGRPMEGLDKALDEVIAGKYDLEAAKAKLKQQIAADKR